MNKKIKWYPFSQNDYCEWIAMSGQFGFKVTNYSFGKSFQVEVTKCGKPWFACSLGKDQYGLDEAKQYCLEICR